MKLCDHINHWSQAQPIIPSNRSFNPRRQVQGLLPRRSPTYSTRHWEATKRQRGSDRTEHSFHHFYVSNVTVTQRKEVDWRQAGTLKKDSELARTAATPQQIPDLPGPSANNFKGVIDNSKPEWPCCFLPFDDRPPSRWRAGTSLQQRILYLTWEAVAATSYL